MMSIHHRNPTRRRVRQPNRNGFTLLELLIATVVTLIMTALVAQMFQFVSDGIFNSRAMIEISDQLRNARHRLVQDLRGVTAPTVPTLDPSANFGYFEYVEGGNVANTIGGDYGSLINVATGTGSITGTLTNTGTITLANTVPGDLDDILMFTTFALDDQFVGKIGGGGITSATPPRAGKSRYAEVAWFTRPVADQPFHNLHRRTFLINGYASWGTTYAATDQSMRQEGGIYEDLAMNTVPTVTTPSHLGTTTAGVVVNTLGDLTMREFRSLHQRYMWPYEMMYMAGTSSAITSVLHTEWSQPTATGPVKRTNKWPAGSTPVLGLPGLNQASSVPAPASGVIPPPLATSAGASSREAEDIILANVVSFDVKAWDPGAPVFRAPLANAATATSNITDTTMVGLIMPGDPGYGGDGLAHGTPSKTHPRGVLHRFIASPTTTANQPVSFGAFADLNYMWLNGCSGEENVISTTSVMNKYLRALATYEDTVLRRNENPPMVRLPRPAFAFANRGRILSGWPMQPPSQYNPDTQAGIPDYAGVQFPAVWDTWSRHYEYDGIDNDFDGVIDEGTNGLDDNNNGFVDEPPVPIDANGDGFIDTNEMYLAELNGERDAPPPFDAPLRGIRVSIRIMEQDSRQVREVATVHEFIPF